LHSRRESTNSQYASYVKRWTQFCQLKRIDTIFTTVQLILEFLQTLVQDGLSYSSIKTTKSALATCVILPGTQTLGTAPDVIAFLWGAFNLRPPVPKRVNIWDPDVMLKYFTKKDKPLHITTELLTKKLAMLILLTTGQRPQTLVALRLKDMIVNDNVAEFVLRQGDVKQGRPGYRPPRVTLRKYPKDEKLCVLTHLNIYVKRTRYYRGDIDQLLLTHKKPYKAATLNSISRWLKELMKAAGINIKDFGPGSARSAATTKAESQGAPIDLILKTAGWTQQSTFARFYKKDLLPHTDISEFILPQQ
jgi:integrase